MRRQHHPGRGGRVRRRVAIVRSRVREWRDPLHRRVLAAVRRGLVLPDLPPRPAVARGAIWAIMLVKNESDILETTVRHLLSQEIDAILIGDNMSSDDTPGIIDALVKEGLPVFAARDTELAFHQGEKMTRLASWARRAGAAWVVPCDADELWFATGTTVGGQLRSTPFDIVRADIHNALPKMDETGTFPTTWLMGDIPAQLHKVAFRPEPFIKLLMGNHDVDHPGDWSDGLHIAHLPYRSPRQMAQKVRVGAESVRTLPPYLGSHWRHLASLDDQDLQDVWRAMLVGQTPQGVGWFPEGRLVEIQPTAWSSWQRLEGPR